MVWHGVAWCGMAWYDMVWCCTVWYGMVWYGSELSSIESASSLEECYLRLVVRPLDVAGDSLCLVLALLLCDGLLQRK